MRCTWPWIAPVVALATVGACSSKAPSVPPASFLVAAGDSTYWIDTRGDDVRVRSAPLFLVRVDGRYHELYLADDDRSYADAVIIGQYIFRRDLITGDSVAVLYPRKTREVANAYAAAHPDATPLAPDEPENDDPSVVAATETEIVGVLGPYLTYEQHIDVSGLQDRDEHTTRRGVIDLRTGRPVSLRSLVNADEAARLVQQAQVELVAARDSVRRSGDARARVAREAISGFSFDSMSFAVIEHAGLPGIAFLVPGRGARAGGYALPLQPATISVGRWWADVRATMPTAIAGGADLWRGPSYDVVARYGADEIGDLYVRASTKDGNQTAKEWKVARTPLPIDRLWRLDDTPLDDAVERAIARAFDEAVLYSGVAKSTSYARPKPSPAATSQVTRPSFD